MSFLISRGVSAYKLKRVLIEKKLYNQKRLNKAPAAPCNSPNIDLNLLEELKKAASTENRTKITNILRGICITLDVSNWDISPTMKTFIHQYQLDNRMGHLSI
tara:strand:+ start:228 stop:536 length:309 start_codon:yes stop_codon:yes gene_type:complete